MKTEHTPYQLEITRRPDGTLNGRPYVTSNGEHVCEGYTNELTTHALQYLVDRSNSAPALLSENARLRSALDGILHIESRGVPEGALEACQILARAALQGGGL